MEIFFSILYTNKYISEQLVCFIYCIIGLAKEYEGLEGSVVNSDMNGCKNYF
jgi:hypothetical protein